MPAPRELNPNDSLLAYWGSELRRLRLEAGMTQRQLAKRTSYSAAYIGHVETAKRMPSRRLAEQCDEIFGTDTLTRLWMLLCRDSYPSWLKPFLELEREAKVIRNFEPLLIPGLLQTRAYAHAVIANGGYDYTSDEVIELVERRMSRQQLLDHPKPPDLIALIDEAALLRPVGGPDVMRAQMKHLLEMAQRPRVTIQVIPLSAGAYPGLVGPVVVIEFRSSGSVAFLESQLPEGQIIQRTDMVETMARQLDAIRAYALPQAISLAMIEKAMEEQWT